jgi:hypothetical protein
MTRGIWRAGAEIGFIIFLFHSNLLMGEFERSGMGRSKGIVRAIEEVFSPVNGAIAVSRDSPALSLLNFFGRDCDAWPYCTGCSVSQ